MSGPIRSVAILGDGITGWSAAAAFARALPQLQVIVVPHAPDPAAIADILPGTTSAIHRFHAAIGLDEAELFRTGAAMPRLALRFEHWGCDADRWFHVHGEHGRPAGSIPFHHYWARARREGRALPWYRYSAAGVLAEARRFAFPSQDSASPLSRYDYGLRIDPPAYRAVLARHGAALGVRTTAPFTEAERRADSGVAALRLADDARVEADLFVDASGPGAILRGGDFEAWDDYYPCRWFSPSEAAPTPPSPYDTLTADPDGWRFEAPLADRMLCGTLHRQPEPGALALHPGRRVEPWAGNVLAIGDAALALDPLHWLPLHAAHEAVLRALDLLPDRDCDPIETREYNRRAMLESERLRDFQSLHHLHAGWDAAASPGLAHLLQQFEARGRLSDHDEDSLSREEWLAALLGLGILPRAMDPLADVVPSDLAASGIAELAAQLATLR